MGVEPTREGDYPPADGFEDREAHRDPSASRVTRGSSYRLYDLGAAPTINPPAVAAAVDQVTESLPEIGTAPALSMSIIGSVPYLVG